MSALFSRGARVAAAALLFCCLGVLLPRAASAQPAASTQWSTFLGGTDADRITALAQNAGRDIVVVGPTLSSSFAEPPATGTRSSTDIFVQGFEYDGASLSYLPLRILGGPGTDEPTAVTFAHDGGVYIVGTTSSPNMTGVGSKVRDFKGATDAFLIRLGTTGAPDWYMYLGGSESDAATGVTVVGTSIYVSGRTNSPDFMNAAQIPAPTTGNGFVVRVDLNPSNPSGPPTVGWDLQPRVVGGLGIDSLQGITSMGDLLLAVGTTNTSTTDMTAVYGSKVKNAFKGGASDAWVVALDVINGDPVWMSYLGGNGKDEGKAIARGINAFVVAGNTASTDLPQTAPPVGVDAFAAWMTPQGGTRLIQLHGGERDEDVVTVTADSFGTAYIGGRTGSTNLPRKALGFDIAIEAESTAPLTREGFVWMLPAWGGLGWDSFAGGNLSDEVTSLAVENPGQLIVGMGTASTMQLPGTTAGHDTTPGGLTDGYLLSVKVEAPTPPQVDEPNGGGTVYDRLQLDDVPQDEEQTASRDSLFANWTAFTSNQETLSYEWAVGTREDPTGVRNFSPETAPLRAAAQGLSLTVGQRYVFTVRGQNRVGLTTGVQSSGVVVTLPDGGLGEPDGGSSGPDGGPGEPDGGEGETDGGSVQPDGGSGLPDGGSGEPDGGTGGGKSGDKDSPLGWGCAAAGGAGIPLLLGLMAFVLLGRKRGQPSR